jgi:hypothetical protein
MIPGKNLHQLEKVAFYVGHPVNEGALVPDSTEIINKLEKITWNFSRKTKEEIWIACFYLGVSPFIAKRLDRSVEQCIVSYSVLDSNKRLRLLNVTCK